LVILLESNLKKLKQNYESGIIKEEDLTEYEKKLLINIYKKRTEKMLEDIINKKKVLYKMYINMKK